MLIEDRSLKTVHEARLDAVSVPGIQRISLEALDVTLEPGVEYQWFVSLVADDGQRSSDIVASGMIQRREAGSSLASQLRDADLSAWQKARVCAQQGFWYDALEVLSAAIERQPRDAGLHAMRADLMQQVGLDAVADYDRRLVSASGGAAAL